MKHPSALAVALAVALVSFAAGCAGAAPQTVVRARAASDLACPGARLDVQGVGGGSFAASGCGVTAVYSCTGGGDGTPFDPTCTRVSEATRIGAAGARVAEGVAESQGR